LPNRFALLLVASPIFVASVSAQTDSANYELASRFAPYKINKMVHSTGVTPRWIEGGEQFWFEWEDGSGKHFYIVDPLRRTKRELFDNNDIAAQLTSITKDPYDGQHLPISSIKFIDQNTLRFDVTSTQDETEDIDESDMQKDDSTKSNKKAKPEKEVFHFEYTVSTRQLRQLDDWEEPDSHPAWASVSPDGETIVFGRDFNLFKMSRSEYDRVLDARRGLKGDKADEAVDSLKLEEIQLTVDGEKYYSYSSGGRGDTDAEVEKNKDKRQRVSLVWSHDSNRFAMTRTDEREVDDLWVVHAVGKKRPELESYKYAMPGEEHVGTEELVVYDLAMDSLMVIDADRFKDQSISVARARRFNYPDRDEPFRSYWLSSDPNKLFITISSRDLKRIDVARVDIEAGSVTTLIEERMNVYLDQNPIELLTNGDMVWWSERDGWAHLYRYDKDGVLKNRITSGAWVVDRVIGIDEKSGTVFFTGSGREATEDPYYSHAYRVGLDGSGLRMLNAGNFDHRTSFSESNRFFVDNYSRVDTVPASSLMDADGKTLVELATADFSKLIEAGYHFPERYSVKAADGVTDLYGVMYKPFDFDSTKSYPIVEYVYPGPQTEAVAKSFSTARYETALAQFGMIVVTVGNRGGHPSRSKWYHTYGYGNLRDYGLADKKVTVEQLASRYDYIDIDRVGIYGHSGGGFMSTAAMLVYPDFFKVAVSSSGNHTNEIYNRWWSERHHGVKEMVDDSGKVSFEYSIESNPALAKNLKGRLLLTTGDVDNNVHPANTYWIAEALIKANKRFDFFLFPGQRHGYGDMSDYWFWLRAEYFVKHLLGDHRWQVDVTQLNSEKEAG
jgi:dipeptidyl aminopeptidase/acylaminoacyl peptidase